MPRRILGAAAGLAVAVTAALLMPSARAQPDEVRIVRDGYGVPHVYSATATGVAYGAGYAIAQDRLFQMEILRALAKGRFVELFGPVPGFQDMDLAARVLFYTDEERSAKVERLPTDLRGYWLAFVDGINAWMDEVRADPSKLPLEFATFALGPPEPWDITDSIAIADTLVETFGAGGGSEVAQAELLQFLTGKFGPVDGPKAFDDLRWSNDPEAPVSIPEDLKWETSPSGARDLPPKEWRRDARLGLTETERAPIGAAALVRPAPAIGTVAQAALLPARPSDQTKANYEAFRRGKEKLLSILHFGSNALITGPQRTTSRGTLQLGGPQVGHFTPEIIAEFGLHAPEDGLDTVGLTFAGAGPAVLIGRGPDYAWTTTTGNSDGADIYVERLGPEPNTYLYDGQIERMDCREETIEARGGLPVETAEVCRTRHGPVLATDEANGIAYSIRRSWFDMETGTMEGFADYNFVDSLEDFATAANKLQSNHNMFYTDARGRFGYWHPGALPIRAPGTDFRLPQDGSTSATEWRRMRTAQEVPHAVDFARGWLANWNNKPAVSWDNGDGANYGAVFHSQLWNDLLGADGEMVFTDVEAFNRINATTELEFQFFRDHIVRSAAASDDEDVRAAGAVLAGWDTRREDNDGDDLVDSEPGYSLFKGWRQLARQMAFEDDLGEDFVGRASDSTLRHVLDGAGASLVKSRDWLNGEGVDAFLERVMRANLDALADEFGNEDMATWRSEIPKDHYTRLNATFFTCEVPTAAGGPTEACADGLPGNVRDLDTMDRGTYNQIIEFRPKMAPPPVPVAAPASDVAGDTLPATGGARAPVALLLGLGLLGVFGLRRRGRLVVGVVGVTVAAFTVPGWAAESFVEDHQGYVVEAESIISPGQSGFINAAGQQDPHYEDQHELYETWRYKPMPLREADVARLGGTEPTVLEYNP